MATSYELTVNDAGDPEAVTVKFICRQVWCKEKVTATGWPRKFEHRRVFGDAPIQNAEGASVIFEGPFLPGDTAGYLNLLAGDGSTTFNIEEK